MSMLWPAKPVLFYSLSSLCLQPSTEEILSSFKQIHLLITPCPHKLSFSSDFFFSSLPPLSVHTLIKSAVKTLGEFLSTNGKKMSKTEDRNFLFKLAETTENNWSNEGRTKDGWPCHVRIALIFFSETLLVLFDSVWKNYFCLGLFVDFFFSQGK